MFKSKSTTAKALHCITLALVFIMIATVVVLGISPIRTLASSTPMVTISMPFTGQWAWNALVNPPYTTSNSSWPGVHPTDGGGDWATDLYRPVGTPVKLWLNNPTGAMSLSLRNTWTSSCSGAGGGIAVNVTIGGVYIGWVSYAHLDNINSTGPFVNGMTVGVITKGSLSSCYSAHHTHLEVKNATAYACWVDNGQPGVTLNEQSAVGVLGATNTGVKQNCTSQTTGNQLGGSNLPSTPIAVSRSSTSMDVFYNDGNGGLVNWSWDVNSGWSSYTWHDTFGVNGSDVINGQPCVVARDSSDMDVFYRTAQGRLIHRGWNATNGWEGPDVLLSSGVGDPTCIARDSGDLQAFFLTPAGEIKSVSWNWQSSWNLNPQMLYSSGATSDPIAISRTSDSMDVFFGKNNGNLVHLGWTAAYGWNTQDWGAGSGVTGKPTAITRNGGGDMSADYEESGGKLGEEFWNWQTGWGWQDWNAQLVGSPSAIPGVAYPIEVFYRETGGNIVDHYFNGTSWASNWIVGAGGATGNPYAIVRGSNEDVFYWNHSTLMDADWNATTGWSTAPVR